MSVVRNELACPREQPLVSKGLQLSMHTEPLGGTSLWSEIAVRDHVVIRV